jgi:hypothetical protein
LTLNRYAKQRDTNEPEIVAAFEAAGWIVVKHVAYDMDVFPPGELRSYPVEVKTKAGRVTESQNALMARGVPLLVVRSADQARGIISNHRQGVT